MILPFLLGLVLQAPKVDLHLVPSGTFRRVGGYAPFGIKTSETAPQGVSGHNLPAGTEYGTLSFGSGASERKFALAIEEPVTAQSRIFVDSKGDGNLTEGAPVLWNAHSFKSADGTQRTDYDASITVNLSYEGAAVPCVVNIYPLPDHGLGYFGDFSLQGSMTLNGVAFDAIYWDSTGCWDPKTAKGTLMIDTDHDGKFHPGYEFFAPGSPFNIKGTTYELTAFAGGLAVAKSSKWVKEKTIADMPGDPNLANGLRPGKSAPTFTEQTMGGERVSFPTGFAGKIVMLDFWATWCGPCMREAPNLAAVYAKYHSRGFDVLGVSLDNPNAKAAIEKTTARVGMSWPQVYQARGWEGGLVKQFGIKSIPATYLVDGDTGKIIAMLDQLRGAHLQQTIEKALAAKYGKLVRRTPDCERIFWIWSTA